MSLRKIDLTDEMLKKIRTGDDTTVDTFVMTHSRVRAWLDGKPNADPMEDEAFMSAADEAQGKLDMIEDTDPQPDCYLILKIER